MLIALILWLLRKKARNTKLIFIIKKALINSSARNKMLALLVLSFLVLPSLIAQQQAFNYYIVYKKNIIGHMQYVQQQSGNDLYLKITSNAETKVLMSIKINMQEEAHYTNDKLVYSHICRYVNGKQKINKQTKATGDCYQTLSNGKNGLVINKPIDFNITLLYNKEPVNNNQVYSDAFQEFVTVKTLKPHVYKIELPDGNYNIYYYQNGICTKVDIHGSLATVQMQLAPNSIL